MSVSSLAEQWVSVARIDPMFERDPATRYRYLLSLREQARAAIQIIDRTGYETRAALAAESELNRKVQEGAPYWVGAAISSYLSVDLGLKVDNRTWRDWVLLQYDKADAGVPYLHPDMLARLLQTGAIQEGWTIDDFRRRCRTFMAITRAREEGAFDMLAPGKIQLGVLEGALLPIVIVIVAVLIIGAIAYVVSEAQKTSQMNVHYQNVIAQVCTGSDGQWRSTPECLAAVQNAMDKDRDKTQMQVMLEQALKYGAVILGVYVLAKMLLSRVGGAPGQIVIRTEGS